MVLRFPFAHIPSRFAENRHRGHHINPVDPGQVRTANAKQLRAQVELRLIASLPADWHLGSDPLFAEDTARSADRTRPSASGKTRNPLVPASAQTADLLASYLLDCARSPPRWPSPGNPETQPAYADGVRPSEWP